MSARAFATTWNLRNDATLWTAGIDSLGLSTEAKDQLESFPNSAVNSDEQRGFRAALCKALLKLPQNVRARVVDLVVKVLLESGAWGPDGFLCRTSSEIRSAGPRSFK